MKISHFIAISLLAVFATAILMYTFMFNQDVYEVREIRMDVRVGDYVGIILDNEILHMGTVTKDGRSNRNVTIANNYDHDIMVKVQFDGAMAGWTTAFPNEFVLLPGEEKDIRFTVSPAGIITEGDYTGIARIFIIRP